MNKTKVPARNAITNGITGLPRRRDVLIAGISLVGAAMPFQALARDNGKYADDNLKPWFDSLTSKKGYCCSVADGQPTEFEIRGDHYWAPLSNGVWTQVPDDAVITVPNLYGRALKWLMRDFDGKETFRCFLPGVEG